MLRLLGAWNSRVWGDGTYKSGTRTYRRYRCRPAIGKPHFLSVLLDDTGQPKPVLDPGPVPPCSEHPGALLVGRLNRIEERKLITREGEVVPVRRHHPEGSGSG